AAFTLDQFASTTIQPAIGASPIGAPTTESLPAPSSVPDLTTPAVVSSVQVTTSTVAVTTTSVVRLLAPTSRVLMIGDSIAFDEWPAVAAAMYAGKIAIGGYVSPGAGLLDNRYE